MRLLVCGSRNWAGGLEPIARELRRLLGHDGSPGVVIHGAAFGVDKIAGGYALHEMGATIEPYPALWNEDDGGWGDLLLDAALSVLGAAPVGPADPGL